MSTNHTDHLAVAAQRLLRTWLTWGVLPLAAALVVTLLVAGALGKNPSMSDMDMERHFQIILAIGAGLFLIAFSLDSKWTNYQKLAIRVAEAAGVDPAEAATAEASAVETPAAPSGAAPEGKRRKRGPVRPAASPLQPLLAAQAPLVFDSIISSTQALAVTGAAIAVCAVMAAAARLGITYSLMLLILAGSYQLFVFSRHAYYRELLAVADAGQLVVHLEKKKEAWWVRLLKL